MEEEKKEKAKSKAKAKTKTTTKKKKTKKLATDQLKAPKKIKILVTIVEKSMADFYMNALEGFDVNLQTLLYAKGTAPTNLRSMLGMVNDGKAVIFSVVQEDRVKEILATYEDKYFKLKKGNGIAFTIPISSLIWVTIYQFLANIDRSEV